MLDDKTIAELIDDHRFQRTALHKRWDRLLASVRAEKSGPWDPANPEAQVERAHLFPYMQQMMATVAAPNPRVTMVPLDPEYKTVARLRQELVNKALSDQKAGWLLLEAAGHTGISGWCPTKTTWSTKTSVPRFHTLNPRHVFFDIEATKHEDLEYVIELDVISTAEFRSRMEPGDRRKKPLYRKEVGSRVHAGAYPAWLEDDTSEYGIRSTQSRRDSFHSVRRARSWVLIYEVWDFTRKRYLHFADGQKQPLLDDVWPYVFVENPYRMMRFTPDLRSLCGISDAAVVERLADMFDELQTLKLLHAKSEIPIGMIDDGAVDNPEEFIDQAQNQTNPGDWIRVNKKKGYGWADTMTKTPTASLQPDWREMEFSLREGIDEVLALSSFDRGIIGKAEVATEVAQAVASKNVRNWPRQFSRDDVVAHWADTSIKLYEEFMPPGKVNRFRRGDSTFLNGNRYDFGFRNPYDYEALVEAGRPGDPGLEIGIEVVAYEAMADSNLAKLVNWRQALPDLRLRPEVDQEAVTRRYLELIREAPDDFILTPEEAAMRQQRAQQALANVQPAEQPAGAQVVGASPARQPPGQESTGQEAISTSSPIPQNGAPTTGQSLAMLKGGPGHPAPRAPGSFGEA